jgi:periplasmic divalent cation tolerance protein
MVAGMPSSACILYVTCPDRDGALGLGRRLVEERLAACANVLPGMRSVYRWQGRIEEADEAVLICKTRNSLAAAATRRIRSLHPYDEPCIVVLPITGGSASYLAWIAAETDDGKSAG